MLNKQEIREKIIKSFAEYGFTVEDVKIGSGYYLFDLGEESVVHFKIKGCKRWLFGLWITGDDKETNIDLFGEHEDYIDKFKPTQVAISEELKISDDSPDLDNEIENLVWSIIYNKIRVIHSSNSAGKIKFYYHGYDDKGVIRWLLGEWWFYRIEYPIIKWFKYKGNKYVAWIVCFILNLIYFKKLKATYKNTKYFSPTYEIYINYKENTNDDDIYDVYKHINGYIGFSESIYIEHIPFGKTRGIYFKKDDKDE